MSAIAPDPKLGNRPGSSGPVATPLRTSRPLSPLAEAEAEVHELSLVVGGPVYDFLHRIGLIRLDLPNVVRRAVVVVALTWLPLLVLSLKDGLAVGDRVVIPFLYDFSMYGRLVIGLSLLMLAEVVIDPAIRRAVGEFVESGIVQEKELPEFEDALYRARRLRNSTLPELTLLAFAFVPVFMFQSEWGSDHAVSSWHTTLTGLGAAGWWYATISAPLFHFIVYRWAFRYVVWALLLWRLSRLDLHLMPTHPDRAAGLHFLGLTQVRFGILLTALGCSFAGRIANSLAYEGTSLTEFKILMGVFVVLSVVIALCPLALLAPKMARIRRAGLSEYARLGRQYTEAFDRKWVRTTEPPAEPLLGTSDIQSLADLGNSFTIIEEMSLAPITKRLVLQLAVLAAAPLIPVILVFTPTSEIVNALVKMVM
jgi:hypothetical protein